MVITLRNKDGKLLVKDILDVDLDMYVDQAESKGKVLYKVVVNSKYTLANTFYTQEEAEDAMLGLATARNDLENELRES